MTINAQSLVWEGVYGSFAEVPCERDVFTDDIWSEKQSRRAEAALAQLKSGVLLPAAAATSDYVLPVVASLLAGAAPLRILDFGGGLGSAYASLRASLPARRRLDLLVVENERLCGIGRRLFVEFGEVRFASAIPDGERFDIVHAGSSMQYVDDWQEMIRRFAATHAEYLLFADLPAGDIDTFVTAQWFHGRRIPVRFWNVHEFSRAVEASGFEPLFTAAFAGAYLERDAALPTAHFDDRHRLERTCQMVFRRASSHMTANGSTHV